MEFKNTKQLLQTLGMLQASRSLTSGTMLFDAIKTSKIKLVIISSDMGLSQKKKITDKCAFYKIDYYKDLITSSELSKAIGRDNVRAVGIKNFSNAKWLRSIIEK
ncbi:L7Ae/L30e/S12e/Gadd45 family ribosomal protein [Spiroplasma endosymbiont of Panorpa germanica]|uniref:L7Ae/L30e/S12e/Gadd45 family ribosomal protein n=1 Tax=Spiroplasma endosymbiont of Panorpa germanica TaxID=3066314 RepID=UPI0030CBA4FA